MPEPLVRSLRPQWHRWRDGFLFRRVKGGRVTYDRQLRCRFAARRFNGDWLEVAVRSYRELRRYLQFGDDPTDVVHRWMHEITDAEVVYDVGSANGLEGFLIHHLHGAKIVFIEPYTPSVETILLTIARQDRTRPVHWRGLRGRACRLQRRYGVREVSLSRPADAGRNRQYLRRPRRLLPGWPCPYAGDHDPVDRVRVARQPEPGLWVAACYPREDRYRRFREPCHRGCKGAPGQRKCQVLGHRDQWRRQCPDDPARR